MCTKHWIVSPENGGPEAGREEWEGRGHAEAQLNLVRGHYDGSKLTIA